MSERIAKPSADAPLYRRGQVVLPATARLAAANAAAPTQRRASAAPVVPAVPTINAWQKPLQSAARQPAGGSASAAAEQQQQQAAGPPPPPPPKQQQMEAGTAAPAATPEPLQAVAPPRSDTPLPAGWNPIGGSAFGLASGLAAACADSSSRAATPGPSASIGDMAGLSAGTGSSSDLLLYPFPAASGGLGNLGGLHGMAAAQPWQQRNGGLGGGAGPTGDETAFLSQLMQGAGAGGGCLIGLLSRVRAFMVLQPLLQGWPA